MILDSFLAHDRAAGPQGFPGMPLLSFTSHFLQDLTGLEETRVGLSVDVPISATKTYQYYSIITVIIIEINRVYDDILIDSIHDMTL